MCFTFFFTFSRGGWIVLAVALVLYFAFTTTRLASFVTLASGGRAGGARRSGGCAASSTLFTETTDDALRTAQGGVLLRWAIAALLVAAGAQLAVALAQRAVRWPRWSAIAAGAAVLAVVDRGRRRRLRSCTSRRTAVSRGSRTGCTRWSPTPSGRQAEWRRAAVHRDHQRPRRASGERRRGSPATTAWPGTGAGTFAFTHYRFRTAGGVVKHAHSQWFNVLSELGVVGLVLFVAAMVLFVAAAVGNPFSRPPRPAAPAARGPAGRRHRVRRPHLLGLGLGHGRGRDARLRLPRGVRLLPGHAGR